MSQRNREAVHVDITPQERVTNVGGQPKITSTNWVPKAGAEEFKQKMETEREAIKQRQLDKYNADPLVQRVIQLENQVAELIKWRVMQGGEADGK